MPAAGLARHELDLVTRARVLERYLYHVANSQVAQCSVALGRDADIRVVADGHSDLAIAGVDDQDALFDGDNRAEEVLFARL